jgi:hypothetical protein
MSRAPPPYMGARMSTPAISEKAMLPSRYSATSGARKNSPTAGATRAHPGGCIWMTLSMTRR